MFPERSVRVNDESKKCKCYLHFWLEVMMLLQATVAKKFLVEDKVTACVNQICLLGFICKVLNRKTLFGETFLFLENPFCQYLNCVLQVTYCLITNCWLVHNQLSWHVLLFSCDLIGQLCLSGPSYSSHTVFVGSLFSQR